MIKKKSIGPAAALLMAAAVLFLGVGYFAPSVFDGVRGSSAPAYVAAMDKESVLDIQIIAEEQDWADMLENAAQEQYIPVTILINGVKIEQVGIRPKGNSSLSMVARDDTTDRYSFKIEFDHYVSGQTWLGLDKLAINNMQGDATYMKEYLSYDMLEYVGVDVPRYAFANISLNGQTWGFYLAVEALEESFDARLYGDDYGKLYKPESTGIKIGGASDIGQGGDVAQMQPGDMRQRPGAGQQNQAAGQQNQAAGQQNQAAGQQNQAAGQQNQAAGQQNQAAGQQNQAGGAAAPDRAANAPGGMMGGMMGGRGGQSGGAALAYIDEQSDSYAAIFENSVFKSTESDYARVIAALKKLDAGEDLQSAVDVEATLRYFAANTVMVNLDSYVSSMCHNYYLYEKDGRLTILPWDFNLSFGGFQSGNASSVVNFPVDTPVSGVDLADRPLLGKLLEVPEYFELYHDYLRQIVDGYLSEGLFDGKVDRLDALISAYVKADPTAFYDYTAYQNGVLELKKLGALRAQSVSGQLSGAIPSTTAAQSAQPDALVDSAALDFSALGSMGGGVDGGGFGGGRGEGAGGEMQGFDREAVEKAMEILQAAEGGALSEQQTQALKELGLTEQQISMFTNATQGGAFGGARPGGDQAAGDQAVGGQGGANRPDTAQGGDQALPWQGAGMGGSAPATGAARGQSWLTLGVLAALLLIGLAFVMFYKRRGPAWQ